MVTYQIDDPLSYSIIGCAMEVHTSKGPGLDEIVYHEGLSALLKAKNVEHLSRPRAALFHRGLVADYFEADIVLPRRLVLELKVLWKSFAADHFCQELSYLKFWRINTGLLFDFGKESLKFKRVVFQEVEPEVAGADDWIKCVSPRLGTATDLAIVLHERLKGVLTEHGLGYQDKTYRGLICADLSAEGIRFLREPIVSIPLPNGSTHDVKADCIVVEQRAAILVVALHERISAAAEARLRTWLRHLGLDWGIVVNFGKKHMQIRFVAAIRNGTASVAQSQHPKDQ